ncbi:MAG: hypothetical protein IJF19_02720 [Clostridia bacterium]|nr:hypothetical protein [Clostridia bacterium]
MITISDGILTIPEGERFVGFSGDNLHAQKKFFIPACTQSGWLYRLYLTFDDGRHNFFTLTPDVGDKGTWLTWDIREDHILKNGIVKAQIKAFSSDEEVYHTTSDVFIAGKTTEEDEEFKNSNSEFLYFEKTLNELYGKMESASAKMPYVGANGNWYTYDADKEAYFDSGVSAEVALGDMVISPEHLDREYWQMLNRNPVHGYDYLDSIIDESDCTKTIYRVELSGLSPIKAVVGEGSFAAIVRGDQSGLYLFNITTGKGWLYEKGSSELAEVLNESEAELELLNGSVTPEHLDREYWQMLNRNPVHGYDYLDSIIDESDCTKAIYRVEFSGLSPIKSVVGEGSFAAIVRGDQSGLYLFNITTGKGWIYEKGSSELTDVKVALDGSLEIADGSITPEKLDRAYTVPFVIVNIAESDVDITLENRTEFRIEGYPQSLSLAFNSVSEDFESVLAFKSGTNATVLTCPSSVKWSGDDVETITQTQNGTSVTYNCLVPRVMKNYNVVFWYDGTCVNAAVRGVKNE